MENRREDKKGIEINWYIIYAVAIAALAYYAGWLNRELRETKELLEMCEYRYYREIKVFDEEGSTPAPPSLRKP